MSHSKKKRDNSLAEKFLVENKNTLTVEEIREKTGRNIKSVTEVLDVFGGDVKDNAGWRQFLRKSPQFKQLKKEFDEDEVEIFQEKFLGLVRQFKDDILATELDQIFHMIKLDLLMSRNLQQRKSARGHTRNMEAQIEAVSEKYEGDLSKLTDEDRDYIVELQKQIEGFLKFESSCDSDYVKLNKEHNDLLKALHGTREQRSRNLNDAKVSFTALVKMLMEKDIADKESRQLGLFKYAVEKEQDRLSAVHTYMDSTCDNPILNSETIEKEDSIPEEPKDDTNNSGN